MRLKSSERDLYVGYSELNQDDFFFTLTSLRSFVELPPVLSDLLYSMGGVMESAANKVLDGVLLNEAAASWFWFWNKRASKAKAPRGKDGAELSMLPTQTNMEAINK